MKQFEWKLKITIWVPLIFLCLIFVSFFSFFEKHFFELFYIINIFIAIFWFWSFLIWTIEFLFSKRKTYKIWAFIFILIWIISFSCIWYMIYYSWNTDIFLLKWEESNRKFWMFFYFFLFAYSSGIIKIIKWENISKCSFEELDWFAKNYFRFK